MKVVQKKVCLLGDFAVGKTSLIRRFVEERFDETYLSTIGVHMSRKRLDRGAHQLDLFIWDLVGGEDFNVVGPNYLRGAAGAIIVCDLTRPNTLGLLAQYAAEVRKHHADAALVFVANKVDLTTERAVTHDALVTAVASYDNSYFLTSAKTGHNVQAVFTMLAERIEKKHG